MINSIESERLTRLIERKEKHYQKLKAEKPDDPALLYLNSEITFLRDEILPIVLTNTTVDYSEIRDYVTRSMRKLERHPLCRKTNDILFHFHLKDSGLENPVVAFATNMRMEDTILFDFSVNGLSEYVVPFYFGKPTIYRLDKNENINVEQQLESMLKICSINS